MTINALVSLSGGMDSTTVLRKCLEEGRDPMAVGFTYGSKHNQFENEAARHVANYYGIPFELINLTHFMSYFKSNLMLGQGQIPEGHYEDESMSQTVVPARNIIFISILAGLAWSRGCDEVWLGIHQGDHAIYPDCRPTFFYVMNEAIRQGTDGRVQLHAPFLYDDKGGIVKYGLKHNVPYLLTRTCYKDQNVACGKCGACVERLEAFQKNGVDDPIEYEK